METNVNTSQFSANQLEFIEWLATPEFAKEIKTQKEFAKKYELAECTLCRWKKIPGLGDAVEQRKRERMRADVLPRILDSATVRASRVGPEHDLKAANKAAEIIFKWLYEEEFGEGTNVNVNNKNVQQNTEVNVPDNPREAREYLFGRLDQTKTSKRTGEVDTEDD